MTDLSLHQSNLLQVMQKGYQATVDWFDRSGRDEFSHRIIGGGRIPYKGIGLAVWEKLIQSGNLLEDRYYVDPYLIIVPEVLNSKYELNITHGFNFSEQANEALSATSILRVLEAAQRIIPGPHIFRSLALIEGGVGRSGTGALTSALLSFFSSYRGADPIRSAAYEVISSGLQPYALFLYSKYGIRPCLPGFIVQQVSSDGPHIIFDNATRGLISGLISFGDNNVQEFRIGEGIGVPITRPLDFLPPILRTAIDELSELFPGGENWGSEFEIKYNSRSNRIALLQHCFVTRQNCSPITIDGKALYLSERVSGTGDHIVEYGVLMDPSGNINWIEHYLVGKYLLANKLPYCVFWNEELIQRDRK